ncbi:MAG: T9SS type A sorting domain-containing protein [Ginsengibacter sp.]
MKKFLLSVSIILSSIVAYCGCPTVNAIIIPTGNSNNYTLEINFIRHGEMFHIVDVLYCDGVEISSGCNTFNINGTMYISFSCTGTPTAEVRSYTGACGDDSNPCETIQVPDPPQNAPTPVVLSNFSAQRTGSSVSTSWQSQQEINADRFEIERSYDNKTFQSVGTVATHGTSSTLNKYSFVDNSNNKKGITLYRIKMIDKDGSVKYTEARTVKGMSISTVDIGLFPNPVTKGGQANISNLKEQSSVQIVDYSGRIISTTTTGNSSSFPLPFLQKGNYFIKITGNESKLSTVKKLTVIE